MNSNIHDSILSLRNDINKLINIRNNTNDEYKYSLLKAGHMPLSIYLLDVLKNIFSLGIIKKPDRNLEIHNKKILIHKKYLPMLDTIDKSINELLIDFHSYTEIANKYFIELSGNYGFGRYPSNWSEISQNIRERDEFKCKYCGSFDRILHVHHIIPLSKGGSNAFSNLITLCEKCHRRKHPHMRK